MQIFNNTQEIDAVINEYILKEHCNKYNDRKETTLAYNCRQYWINHNYCSLKEVAENNNTTEGNVRQYFKVYNWTKIKNNLSKLKALRDRIKLNDEQKHLEEKHRKSNEMDYKAITSLIERNYIDLGLTDKKPTKELKPSQENDLKEETLKLLYYKLKLQNTERINVHLPNKYNHNIIEADVDLNWLKEIFGKNTDKESVFKHLDNYADYFNSINQEANRSIDIDNGNK